jgi:hypothetical protein
MLPAYWTKIILCIRINFNQQKGRYLQTWGNWMGERIADAADVTVIKQARHHKDVAFRMSVIRRSLEVWTLERALPV